MAFFVLMGLIAILIVYISVAKKKKRALLISVVILGMFYLYVRHTCGPNQADVKVMTPMAEAISNYIVKHGMPDNLEDIPILPYKIYQNKNDDPSFYYFQVGGDKYTIFKKSQNMLELSSDTKRGNGYTWLWLIFEIDKNGDYSLKRKEFFLAHTSGICSTLKQ